MEAILHNNLHQHYHHWNHHRANLDMSKNEKCRTGPALKGKPAGKRAFSRSDSNLDSLLLISWDLNNSGGFFPLCKFLTRPIETRQTPLIAVWHQLQANFPPNTQTHSHHHQHHQHHQYHHHHRHHHHHHSHNHCNLTSFSSLLHPTSLQTLQ